MLSRPEVDEVKILLPLPVRTGRDTAVSQMPESVDMLDDMLDMQ